MSEIIESRFTGYLCTQTIRYRAVQATEACLTSIKQYSNLIHTQTVCTSAILWLDKHPYYARYLLPRYVGAQSSAAFALP